MVPVMEPAPGERLRRFVGDEVRFVLKDRMGRSSGKGWRGVLRTNLGRADVLRREIIEAHTSGLPLAGASWRDVPMKQDGDGWSLAFRLAEAGYFKAKAFLIDPRGWQHWPAGPDAGISVHPDQYRTANTIYCAFPRLFGPTRTAVSGRSDTPEGTLAALDEGGYTVIPRSGKLRDLTQQLPHILGMLGCRILHLLPVNPAPTTYARFGRFGSPYAALDLTAIDPALVMFDRRTTGIDQFRELTYETHLRGGRVFLDIVINHTGWGSSLQEEHPEWFQRRADGTFESPGAWGATWEDLVELRHRHVALWDELAKMFLTWCRRGVDGFRCDAGYKVPLAAWQYLVARVQQEFPETIFLLEGLGGAWETTEALLSEGGLQWAYSELFQNYSGQQVAGYLDHSSRQSKRVGLLVHYSETHDNDRLAARGRAWSLLRNRLCALASESGGFGFTCGVEWLAAEKIKVHENVGLAWGQADNLVPEIARLNALLRDHPCFFDGARLTRLSGAESPVYALRRESEEGQDEVLVLVNTDADRPHSLSLERHSLSSEVRSRISAAGSQGQEVEAKTGDPGTGISEWVDLLGQQAPEVKAGAAGAWVLTLSPGAAYCLAPTPTPRGLHGDQYRRARQQAAWALKAMSHLVPPESVGRIDWRELAGEVDRSPAGFLAKMSGRLQAHTRPTAPASASSAGAAEETQAGVRVTEESGSEEQDRDSFPLVVTWTLLDRRRLTLVPPGHWLLIQDDAPFRATLSVGNSELSQNVESIPAGAGHICCYAPRRAAAEATLVLERYAGSDRHVQATIRYLDAGPQDLPRTLRSSAGELRPSELTLLTNGRGGMARISVDLGRVNSKYDCVLGANLHPSLPVDRHVLAKRLRVWISADGFISPLDFRSLASFEPGPPAAWNFVANAGDGRTVEIRMTAEMPDGSNTTVFRFSRPSAARATGKQLPAQADVRLTVRVDIEDRNFHWETKRNGGAEHHFSAHTAARPAPRSRARERASDGFEDTPGADAGQFIGFAFTPAPDRVLQAFCDRGQYHPQAEWSENIPHPVEQTRGQTGSGDAYSPGWFELPLLKGASVKLVVTAEASGPEKKEHEDSKPHFAPPHTETRSGEVDDFGSQLLRAARAFVVRRDQGKTVIAGYPWFLDWGRDTFISARGLLAAGMAEEVKQILLTFARFEQKGTLPNTIFGEDASNRDTSDAPLWFGVVCEELSAISGNSFYQAGVGKGRATITDTLLGIACSYIKGTPNGIRMDAASALIWSPSHFTWMDTNYPACTPREGYPVEIQALWIRLLRQLALVGGRAASEDWQGLAEKALASLEKLFWREERGYYADVLTAKPGQAAEAAVADDALRSNGLFAVSLGLVAGERARRCVEAARRYLVVPGALRSLAPLPVSVPLPNYGNDGRLLNNPAEPYWGRYEGDEDTRRKPAYHNGTAWTWTFPSWCEALARAWNFSPAAVAAARAYLGSMDRLMAEGCIGQIPEIVDGDAPHTQRGCDAQAWGATEALRVWKLLEGVQPAAPATIES